MMTDTIPYNIFWPVIDGAFVFPGDELVYNGNIFHCYCVVNKVDFENNNGKISPVLFCKSKDGKYSFTSGILENFSRPLPNFWRNTGPFDDPWEKLGTKGMGGHWAYYDIQCENCTITL